MQSYSNYAILFCIFVTGFLVSRIFVRTGLATSTVIYFSRLARGHISYLLLLLIGSSAFLSSFIPNTLTILTLIPILRIIGDQYKRIETTHGQLTTPIVISVIYGSNIGGMASIIGSPANALLLGFLPLLESRYNTQIAGRENISFLSWFGFGAPTAILLIVAAWVLIYALLVPKRLKAADLDFTKLEQSVSCPLEIRRAGLLLSLTLLVIWISISVLHTYFPQLGLILSLVAATVTLGFSGSVFFWRISGSGGSTEGTILTLKDCFVGLPTRGVLLAVAAAVLSGILMLLKVPEFFGSWLTRLHPSELVTPLTSYIVIALFVTFLTEFLSNTTVALTFFPVVFVLSSDFGLDPLLSLLVVSLSTTCAFMSPIATPVNALAFGSIRDVSLRKMLLSGLIMNLISSVWLAWSVTHLASTILQR